jgi:NCS1 family nucleobase:cation symporter-1
MCRASGFLSFLSGYTIFIGPFVGIMIADVSKPIVIGAR